MAKSRKPRKSSPKKKALVSPNKRDKRVKAKSRVAPKQVTLIELRKQARGLDIPGISKLSRTSLTRKINLAKRKLAQEKLARKLAREARIKARERAQRAAARALAKKQEALEYERKRLLRNARAKARRAALKLLELSRRGAPIVPPPEVVPPAPIS